MRKTLGVLLVLVGLVGVVAGPVGALVIRSTVNDLAATADVGLELGDTGLDVLQKAVTAASTTLTQAAESLDEVSTAVLVAGSAIEDSQSVLVQVAEVSGKEIPDAIDSVRDAMPALVQVAAAVDRTLRAIAFISPTDYDPDVPFDESILAIDSSLEAMKPSLEAQARLIEEASTGFSVVVDHLDATTTELTDLRDALRVNAKVLDESVETVVEARVSMAEIGHDLGAQVAAVNRLIVVFGFLFGLAQVSVLIVGIALFRGEILVSDKNSQG